MKYQSETIGAIMLDLNNEYFLPSIQRPYVWETDKIIRLFDSIMWDYPIGSFLFWKLDPENRGDWEIYKFISFFQQGSIHNDLASLPDGKAVTLVLDGQQRLTSLCISLMGNYKIKRKGMRRTSNNAWITKGLYLNLLKSPSISNNENVSDENHYEFDFFDIYKPPKNSDSAFWFKVSDMFRLREEREYQAFYIEMSTMLSQYGEYLKAIGLSNLQRLRKVI